MKKSTDEGDEGRFSGWSSGGWGTGVGRRGRSMERREPASESEEKSRSRSRGIEEYTKTEC